MKAVQFSGVKLAAPLNPQSLRIAALGRRVSTSGALAAILADLAFGVSERDDLTALHFTSAARVATALAVRS